MISALCTHISARVIITDLTLQYLGYYLHYRLSEQYYYQYTDNLSE
jgi:hypothetical protein